MHVTSPQKPRTGVAVVAAFLTLFPLALAASKPERPSNQAWRSSVPQLSRTGNDSRVQQGRSPSADLADLRKRFVGKFVETPFAGIYLLDAESREAAPRLFASGARVVINNGVLGMTKGPGGPRLTESEQREFLKPLLPSLGVDRFIQFGGKGPLRLVILSAIDCPYCRKLEAKLATSNLRYAVIPNAISLENMTHVRNAYCSADPAKAWSQAILHGRPSPRAPDACKFDFEGFWIISGLLGSSTPRLLYADGSLMRPDNENPLPGIQSKLAKLSAEEVSF